MKLIIIFLRRLLAPWKLKLLREKSMTSAYNHHAQTMIKHHFSLSWILLGLAGSETNSSFL